MNTRAIQPKSELNKAERLKLLNAVPAFSKFGHPCYVLQDTDGALK
jgi:hypothetical protein